MILHLVRHPKPAIAPGICYGQLDISAENVAAVAIGLRDELPPGSVSYTHLTLPTSDLV